jgi:hypothetical protein
MGVSALYLATNSTEKHLFFFFFNSKTQQEKDRVR